MRGGFFTFEGIDGSGKTTQIKLLSEFFDFLKINYYITREPGGTQLSKKIRELILMDNNEIQEKFSHKAQFYLFLSSMAQNIDSYILPALKSKKVVVSDRFFDSTLVYQSILCKKSFFDLKKQKYFLFGGLKIDYTILLDIDPVLSLKRLKERQGESNKFDKMDIKFYQDLRNNYLQLAKKNYKIKIIDATQNSELIFKQIVNHFNKILHINNINTKIDEFLRFRNINRR